MKLVHACLPLLLAVVAISDAFAEGRKTCVVSPDAIRHARVADDGVRAVAAADQQSPGVEFACRDGGLSAVSVAIVPGQGGEIRLLAGSAFFHGQAPGAVDGSLSEWSAVTTQRRDSGGQLVILTLSVPASAKVGRVYTGRLRLGAAESGVEIPLRLEIVEEQPLFRDEFDVDPVIGQFSLVQ